MDLVTEIQATAELCGQALSKPALAVLTLDLGGYPEAQVRGALRRCRREHKGRLTAEAVVSRLDDGRPGAEQAWAMIPQDEHASVVWTAEMAEAYGAAGPLLAAGDAVAARMAFREVYSAAMVRARDERRPPVWTPSLGRDPAHRETVLRDAVERGRISMAHARAALPSGRFSGSDPALPAPDYVVRATRALTEREPA